MAERKPPYAPKGFAIPVGHEREHAGYKPAQSRILKIFVQALYNHPPNTGEINFMESNLEINSDLKDLKKVRRFMRCFCMAIPGGALNEDRIGMIEVAANELAANIIKHAYLNQPGEPIKISAYAYPDKVCFEFFDRGIGFDPKAAPPPVFDGRKESGFGMHIIKRVFDDVMFFRDESGNNRAVLTVRI